MLPLQNDTFENMQVSAIVMLTPDKLNKDKRWSLSHYWLDILKSYNFILQIAERSEALMLFDNVLDTK